MRRREFIAIVGGAATWTLPVQAQKTEVMRRVALLLGHLPTDPIVHAYLAAFHQRLQDLGWTAGRNIKIDYHWAPGDAAQMRRHADELQALAPDVIVVSGTQVTTVLLQTVKTIPVIFVNVSDPLARGLVRDWSRPGGNATGFASFDPTICSKWMEALKEIAPTVTRILVLLDPENPGSDAYLQAVQGAGRSLALQVIPVHVSTAAEVERSIEDFAKEAGAGLIVLPSASATTYRDTVVALAMRHRLPAAYAYTSFVKTGGLVSYSTDQLCGRGELSRPRPQRGEAS
jgi:putative tryptophan/tyrosine transport system substrate-binding protein